MPQTARIQRIEAQMQRSLATRLLSGVKDPRVGRLTVTGVMLAPDLSVARVLVMPFGMAPAGTEVLAGLHSAAGYLRGQLAKELRLRHAPRLEFELDTHLEHAAQLSKLIDTAVREDRERSAPTDEPGNA